MISPRPNDGPTPEITCRCVGRVSNQRLLSGPRAPSVFVLIPIHNIQLLYVSPGTNPATHEHKSGYIRHETSDVSLSVGHGDLSVCPVTREEGACWSTRARQSCCTTTHARLPYPSPIVIRTRETSQLPVTQDLGFCFFNSWRYEISSGPRFFFAACIYP